eukprot:9159893-Pyramimonas_sp.AAC.1
MVSGAGTSPGAGTRGGQVRERGQAAREPHRICRTIFVTNDSRKRSSHLQDDLLRRLVGVEEGAHVDEGPLLAAGVLALEVVPAKLDQLLAVLHQLLRHLP